MPSAAGKRSLQWKWDDGSVASFGDPATTTEIAICLYDAAGRQLATATRPDAALWTDRGDSGLRFKDRDARPSGLRSMQLRSGAGTARILLKGKGASLPDVASALVAPVTVQLVGSDTGECAESVFSSGDITTNEAGRFSATLP
jgi:hypothetical protein